jgi:hypothetical protein
MQALPTFSICVVTGRRVEQKSLDLSWNGSSPFGENQLLSQQPSNFLEKAHSLVASRPWLDESGTPFAFLGEDALDAKLWDQARRVWQSTPVHTVGCND